MGAALCIWSVVCLVFLLYLSNEGLFTGNLEIVLWLTSFIVALHVLIMESIYVNYANYHFSA